MQIHLLGFQQMVQYCVLPQPVTRQSSDGTQMPPQSAPPRAGSQLSLGLSMHEVPAAQGIPAMPPQVLGVVSTVTAWHLLFTHCAVSPAGGGKVAQPN
jgi:hypothetical protein